MTIPSDPKGPTGPTGNDAVGAETDAKARAAAWAAIAAAWAQVGHAWQAILSFGARGMGSGNAGPAIPHVRQRRLDDARLPAEWAGSPPS